MNIQTIPDKISLLLFELSEIIRLQALRTDMTPDEKMEFSQNEYDIEEKLRQHFLAFERMRQYHETQNLPFNPDLSVFTMAGEEHEQACALRERLAPRPAGSQQNPIVIE